MTSVCTYPRPKLSPTGKELTYPHWFRGKLVELTLYEAEIINWIYS